MNKIWLLTAGFSLLALTCASAETYRCRTPDGKLVMTDQQSQLPDDCQSIDESTETGSFNIIPGGKGVDTEVRPVEPAKRAESRAPIFTSLQDQAKALVQNHKEAVTRRYRPGLEVDGCSARPRCC